MFQQSQAVPSLALHARQDVEQKQGMSALAREVMTAANWDIEVAMEQLRARILDDEALLTEAVDAGLRSFLSTINSGQRHRLIMKAVAPGKDDTRALQRMASQSVLDTYNVGSKHLGDCSPAELLDAISFRKSAAQSHGREAAFLTAVLKKLKPNTKRVRDELNEDDARRLRSKFPC